MKKKFRRLFWAGWWTGMMMSLALSMAVQDTFGLEGYITHLRRWWINTPVWLGYAVFVLGVIMCVLFLRASAELDE